MGVLLRVMDIILSIVVLIIAIPFFLIIIPVIKLSGRGPVFYTQERIGRNGKPFKIIKFRTMIPGSDKHLLLTTKDDNRITIPGRFLRRYKLDELPQLINVLKGEMSIVGPRPEVRRYVDMYTPEQKQVLNIRPGITDFASIYYSDENNILAEKSDPEDYYTRVILPHKLQLNMIYVNKPDIKNYFSVIFKTIGKLIR